MHADLSDRLIRELKMLAESHHVDKIILFGSRARGTNTDRSDIDIAVCGGDFDAFFWDVKENAHTLLSLDIVDHDLASAELKAEIQRDGVTIYEKA